MSVLNTYLEKKNSLFIELDNKPGRNLKFVVVIPCYNEKGILNTLKSLDQTKPINQPIEVLIVINSAQSTHNQIIEQNKTTYNEIAEWVNTSRRSAIQYHPIYVSDIPDRDAGPGIARKIGMDTALFRLSQTTNKDGYIVSLDADCLVEPNYFEAIEKVTTETKKVNAGIIYFEHPTEGIEFNQSNYRAVAQYELFHR